MKAVFDTNVLIAAFLTAVFMFRLIFLTFFGENRASAEVQGHIHESSKVMTVPLLILAVPAALLGLVVGLPPEGGWVWSWIVCGVLFVPRPAEGAITLACPGLRGGRFGALRGWELLSRQHAKPCRPDGNGHYP